MRRWLKMVCVVCLGVVMTGAVVPPVSAYTVATAMQFASLQNNGMQNGVQLLGDTMPVYPRSDFSYLTAEAQGIVCPVGKVVHISAFGDSLSSGYGLPDPTNAFPCVLQEVLRELGYCVVVTNDSVEGETTEQGLRRLPKVLARRPDILILELGANDMLQHRSVERMKTNLEAMVRLIRERQVQILFTGMYSLPHFGNVYADAFDAVFPDVARRFDVPFYPFFLEGVALDHSLNQQDGHHPNAEGVHVIVRNMLPSLVPLIKKVCGSM